MLRFKRSKHNERATKRYQKEQKKKKKPQHKLSHLQAGKRQTTTHRPRQLFMLLTKSETQNTPLGLCIILGRTRY